MSRSHAVVIGGGISGLTGAWALAAAGLDVTVLEQRDVTGGVVRRARVSPADGTAAPPKRGWPTLDQGAEALLARRPEALDLIDDLGLTEHRCTPRVSSALIASRGRLHPMPAGTLYGVPADPRTLAGLLTPDEVARAVSEPADGNPPATADASVADVIGGRLGAAVVDRLVEPLLGGVYAGRVDRLSLPATIPGLWEAARTGRGLAATVLEQQATAPASGPVFTGLVGGVARLAETLTARLHRVGAQLWTGACAQQLERDGSRWRVRLGPAISGPVLDADVVLVAVPAPPTRRLLAGQAHDPAPIEALGEVPLASMALVSAVLPEGTLDGLDGSGVLVPSVEGRLVKAMTFSSRKWDWVREEAGGRDVLRLSVGRVGQEQVLHRPDDDLVAAALDDAGQLLGRPLPAVATRVQRWGGSLPQYDVGHGALVAAARAEVDRIGGVQVAGSIWGGVGIPACIATARAGAAALLDDLPRR